MSCPKIVLSPKVYLLSKHQVIKENYNAFLRDHGWSKFESDATNDSDLLPEIAGRLCYLSFLNARPAGPDRSRNYTYLDHIKEVGHGSVLEHPDYVFVFTQIDRSVTHELVRHRAGTGFSQLSSRYVDQFDEEQFGDEYELGIVCPMEIWNDDEMLHLWKAAWAKCAEAYQQIGDRLTEKFKAAGHTRTDARKMAREDAVSILPQSFETMIAFKVNARELRHIFNLRCSEMAQKRICALFMLVYDLVKDENIFKDFEEMVGKDGRRCLRTKYPKV